MTQSFATQALMPTETATVITLGNPPSRPPLSEALFHQFATLIYELSGMRFELNKSYFVASKIDLRVRSLGFPHATAYLAYLEGPWGRHEYDALIDEVTIQETFFFRHEPQLQAFRDDILMPLFFARRTQRQLRFRILSAATSTGDELYTLALMLKDLGLTGRDIQFELIGTDICHDAVEKARTGTYRKYNIRNVPTALLQQYFTYSPGTGGSESWALKPEIKSMCHFQQGNLMDAARTTALGKFDIIFCRNALTYFDETSKEKVVRNLSSILADDGHILLGHSENIYSQRHILRPDKTHANAIAYTKAPPGTPNYNV